jgi:hypothetical protein
LDAETATVATVEARYTTETNQVSREGLKGANRPGQALEQQKHNASVRNEKAADRKFRGFIQFF